MTLRSLAMRLAAAAAFLLGASAAALGQIGVLTHHYDYARTGWNYHETALTPSTFTSGSGTFGVIATVSNLDSQIYAQPLLVPNLLVNCPANQTIVTCQAGLSGVHDVVFVATWNNSVYAIDADTGAILLKRNFGAQGNCGGINSTPVIDPATGTLYVMTHILANGVQTYDLYALKVGTLLNAMAPAVITGANTFHTLTDGTTYAFDTARACQKTALLLVGGNIYAGFRGNEFLSTGNPPTLGSGPTRGWLLGWNASTLTPLPPLLTNQQATSQNTFFLTSIWMSTSGVASDGTNLYFSTGNSDPSGTSYDPVLNIEESVVEVSSNLAILSLFTPSNYASLDLNDNEVGGAGVMILRGSPPFVVAGAKDGRMFLLDGASLGGYTPGGPDKVLDVKNIGDCWCAPSYFIGSDGVPRIVSSGGTGVVTWELLPTGKLVPDGQAQIAASTQDPGFFTSVSSNDTSSAVIWAVSRPNSSNAVTLYAFDATSLNGTLPLLGSYPAGTWVDSRDSDIVPVVANGKVYVTSGNASTPTGTLTIFGVIQ